MNTQSHIDAIAKRNQRGGPLPKILLVDDDPAFGRIMIKFASRANLELTYCSSVKDLERLPVPSFDIIIIDYDLQNLSGIQLLRTLSRLRPSIPAILVSSYRFGALPEWDPPISRFICKSEGPLAILSQALSSYEGGDI